jgi:hypothetical protein
LMLWLRFESEKSGFCVYTIPILRRPLDPLRGSRSGAEVNRKDL